MANANEFVITEHRCEMCKSYGPGHKCRKAVDMDANYWPSK